MKTNTIIGIIVLIIIIMYLMGNCCNIEHMKEKDLDIIEIAFNHIIILKAIKKVAENNEYTYNDLTQEILSLNEVKKELENDPKTKSSFIENFITLISKKIDNKVNNNALQVALGEVVLLKAIKRLIGKPGGNTVKEAIVEQILILIDEKNNKKKKYFEKNFLNLLTYKLDQLKKNQE